MNYCPQCGKKCSLAYRFCPICGTAVNGNLPFDVSEKRKPFSLAERKALAGFVLSLFGILTMISVPLQALGLFLSLSARGIERNRVLRIFGIVFSAVSLLVSLLFWGMFLFNYEAVLDTIVKFMYY